MSSSTSCFTVACLTALALAMTPAAEAQHVHGRIELGIVQEDSLLAVSLSAPLGDLVGFEHRPEDPGQERLLADAVALLVDPDAMFSIPGNAQCKATEVVISGPEFVAANVKSSEGQQPRVSVVSASDENEPHHSDRVGDSLEESHGHDEAHDHDEDDHHDHDSHHSGEAHADVSADYTFECSNVADLDAFSLLFPGRFAAVDEVILQVITASQTLVEEVRSRGAEISVPLR